MHFLNRLSSSPLDRSPLSFVLPAPIKMAMEIVEPNTCVRGCCTSESIPLHLSPSSFTLLSPIARGNCFFSLTSLSVYLRFWIRLVWGIAFSGSESVVYEATLNGRRVAAKKPILSTSDDLDKFHKHLQLLWYISLDPFEKVSYFTTFQHKVWFFFLLIWWSNLDHPGVAKLVAAHAKPPNYLFFFEFYEAGTLAEKLHVEEWSPSVDQVLTITLQLGIWLISLWWWILNRYIYEPKSVSFMFQLRHCSISTRMGLFIGMWNQLMFL